MTQTDIIYKDSKTEILLITDAYLQEYDKDYAGIDGYHLASIITWSKDSNSCVLFWRDNFLPMQLCNDMNNAKELITKYLTKVKEQKNGK